MSAPLSHAAAIKALCDCAASVSVLSYQEAIEGYFKLRGLPVPDAASTGAQAQIHDGKIVISIDVDALPIIVSGSCATGNGLLGGLWKVTDPAAFAKEVCLSLNNEAEDGTTRVHTMFDKAFEHAIEQGGEGIESVSEEEFEEESARLRFRAPMSEGER